MNRGVFLWNGDGEGVEAPPHWLDDLVYEALGDQASLSNGYELEGIKVTIEVNKATKQ